MFKLGNNHKIEVNIIAKDVLKLDFYTFIQHLKKRRKIQNLGCVCSLFIKGIEEGELKTYIIGKFGGTSIIIRSTLFKGDTCMKKNESHFKNKLLFKPTRFIEVSHQN
jgi:hypothetical protein